MLLELGHSLSLGHFRRTADAPTFGSHHELPLGLGPSKGNARRGESEEVLFMTKFRSVALQCLMPAIALSAEASSLWKPGGLARKGSPWCHDIVLPQAATAEPLLSTLTTPKLSSDTVCCIAGIELLAVFACLLPKSACLSYPRPSTAVLPSLILQTAVCRYSLQFYAPVTPQGNTSRFVCESAETEAAGTKPRSVNNYCWVKWR